MSRQAGKTDNKTKNDNNKEIGKENSKENNKKSIDGEEQTVSAGIFRTVGSARELWLEI